MSLPLQEFDVLLSTTAGSFFWCLSLLSFWLERIIIPNSQWTAAVRSSFLHAWYSVRGGGWSRRRVCLLLLEFIRSNRRSWKTTKKRSRLFFSPRISRSLFRHTAVFCLSLSVGILLHEVNLVQEERRTGYITSTHEAKRDMEQSDKQRRERERWRLSFFTVCTGAAFGTSGGVYFQPPLLHAGTSEIWTGRRVVGQGRRVYRGGERFFFSILTDGRAAVDDFPFRFIPIPFIFVDFLGRIWALCLHSERKEGSKLLAPKCREVLAVIYYRVEKTLNYLRNRYDSRKETFKITCSPDFSRE